MNHSTLTAALALALFLVVAGCRTAPIYNVEHAPVTTNKPHASLDDVEKAIVRAGAGLGWQMRKIKPGLIDGTLYLRSHVAEVSIPYSTQEYSIRYKNSQNLNYQAGQIHKNYNSWVQNLDNAIRSELLAQP